jgi:hypothetical protein
MVNILRNFTKLTKRLTKKKVKLCATSLLFSALLLQLFNYLEFLQLLLGVGVYSSLSRKNPCSRTFYEAKRAEIGLCAFYDEQDLFVPNCSGRERIVPRIIHSVGRNKDTQISLLVSRANPSYTTNQHDDKSAAEFILEKCGRDAMEAYACFIAPSFRADLFRFCALYTQGGVYLDEDIIPLHSIDDIISSCSIATVGHDFPFNHRPAKQMKILASAPKAPIMGCALQTIINNARNRAHPRFTLELTGPAMLQQCYELHPNNVAITYKDTRGAVWPYSGMRAGNIILAYEYPSPRHFCYNKKCDRSRDYNDLYKRGIVYNDACSLS